MKLEIHQTAEGRAMAILHTPTTQESEEKSFMFPAKNIHHWYPFNCNFSYKYTNAEEFLYLIKENNYVGENVYKTDILKRTKPMGFNNGVPFNPLVYKRNKYIINKAKQLGIPVITEGFNAEYVDCGFRVLGQYIDAVRDNVAQKYSAGFEVFHPHMIPSETNDKLVYQKLSPEEETELHELSEIYGMLTVMRKIIKEV